MNRCLSSLAVVALSIHTAEADVYMHNPRGSNDRNCERNVNRNNGNRLFDSQNNNNGGYACPRAVGSEDFQAEDGTASFTITNRDGSTETFTQNKRLYYYSGSVVPIEWTNQHGCGGNSKVSCEMVLQYACEDTLDPRVDNFWPWVENKAEEGTAYFGQQHFRDITGDNIAAPRDGVPIDSNDAATDTIPDNEDAAIPDSAGDRRYGMQESYDFYQLCQRTERNKGLYTADQRVNRNDQRGTRQNPNGNRRGLECPEERDYYPWWHPSPWIDIAVLTDSAENEVCYPQDTQCSVRCLYYQTNTMNYYPKGYCDVDHDADGATVQTKLQSTAWQQRKWYNNRDACEAAGFRWYEVSHSDNLDLGDSSFVCAKTQFSRANQLGNAQSADSVISQTEQDLTVADQVNHGVNANRFLWTVPNIPTVNSNTFTDESDYFTAGMENAYKSCVLRMRYNISSADFQQWPEDSVDAGTPRMVDARNNSNTQDDPNTPLLEDPYVYIGPGDSEDKGDQFVKLKVNTNQYGRTFQDRSYVFSIKPLPSKSAPAENDLDTPAIDVDAVTEALSNGGRIYNVNVRGKRGNIVQTYPSVEYDFIPNALALSDSDMIHFQWTGSDYNPRRGCNDATGGPPDANTFFTDANANKNPRADRSNVVFTNHMGENVPKDYLGYDQTDDAMAFANKTSTSRETILADAPCYDPSDPTATEEQADACYDTIVRLAYLNQQSDVGSLLLRQSKDCLTAEELDAINNEDVADFHPLNCAKMNAKPYPYFDGGIMMMKKSGWFPYFSSRNNNFSNRQQIGVICVGEDCDVDPDTGVLQDMNPQDNGDSIVRRAASTCYDTAGGDDGANSNAVISCIRTGNVSVLTAETIATQEGDNDNYGDGNAQGCAVAQSSFSSGSSSSGGKGGDDDNNDADIALAIILLFVGIFCSWLAYYLYNRYQARKDGESKFRYDTAWIAAAAPDARGDSEKNSGKRSRPGSARFDGVNPSLLPQDEPPTPKGGSGSGSTRAPSPMRAEHLAAAKKASNRETRKKDNSKRIEMV